jgi:type IV pilus assembly protein PilM
VASILSKLKSGGGGGSHGASTSTRPPAAVELTTTGVIAAALPAKSSTPVYAFEALKAGALKPGTSEANLVDSQAVSEAIRSVLASAEPRSRAITLIVPDLSARVFVLDFDALPAKAAESASVIRFRLRKMVPFEVEQAGVSYQILEESRQGLKVLVAVIPSAILAEYEAAVRTSGYEPGAILTSGLAVLAAVEGEEPALVANLSAESLTTAVTDGRDLQLYRTIELPHDDVIQAEGGVDALLQGEIQRDLAVAVAYYEDRLGEMPKKLHFAGTGGSARFAEWIGELDASLASMALVDVASVPERGMATALGTVSIAAVKGALVGVN